MPLKRFVLEAPPAASQLFPEPEPEPASDWTGREGEAASALYSCEVFPATPNSAGFKFSQLHLRKPVAGETKTKEFENVTT